MGARDRHKGKATVIAGSWMQLHQNSQNSSGRQFVTEFAITNPASKKDKRFRH